MKNARFCLAVLACTLLAAATPAVATDEPSTVRRSPGPSDPETGVATPRFDGHDVRRAVSEMDEVIVGRTRGAAVRADLVSLLVELDRTAERQNVLDFAKELGGHCKFEYKLLPGLINLRRVPRNEIDRLKSMPGVKSVREDREFRIDLVDSTPHVRALQSQVNAVGISADGSGVRVCVIDTGIDPDHTMFAARIDTAAGYDFHNDDPDPTDDHGHGSHVSGIVLGRVGFEQDFGGGNGSEPLSGVAPLATLVGVKVLGASGGGRESDVIAGIEHCADPALPGGPADVINMSLGAGVFTSACDIDFAAQASNNAVTAGVVVVASAGNGGRANGIGAPACASGVIAVAATYDDSFPNPDFPTINSFSFLPICSDPNPTLDRLTCFSNRSNQVDVAAPGCLTYSADGLAAATTETTGLCGTSMSAPHVAGLVALILDQAPETTPAEVRQRLHDGAVDLGAPGWDTGYGHGRIDVITTLKLGSSCSIDADCDDGLYCNGAELCSGSVCRLGVEVCGGRFCDEDGDSCVDCTQDAECDDGLQCNGLETCDVGACSVGGEACGVLCDPVNNICVECFGDTDCDDGDFCNGIELCSSVGDCVIDITDCNDNGVEDLCDVADQTSLDVDPQNGSPDECDDRVRFRLLDIPSLGGARSEAYALNDSGHVVGFSETGELSPEGRDIFHGFVWDAATLTDLGTLGGQNSLAYDINEAGVIAGWADPTDPSVPPELFDFARNQPTIWTDGVPTQLTLLDGFGWFNGAARALNNVGHVGGHSINGFELIRGTIWGQQKRPVEVPPMPNADATDVWDIADNGDSVGWRNETYLGFTRKAFRMPFASDTPQELGTLGGNWSWALGISERGDIVGQSADATGFFRPFLWQGSQTPMIDLGAFGGSFALARSINMTGRIVGMSTHPQSQSLTDSWAFYWENGTLERLNDLVPGNLGWNLRDAWDINESGQIAGHGIDPAGTQRGFRLDPCGGAGNPCFVSDCQIDADCDDDLYCNGHETCPGGFCIAGIPPSCGDADPCTIDFCDEAAETCRNVEPSAPSAVQGLELRATTPGSTFVELSWTVESEAASYNVYRATQPDLSDVDCLLTALTGTNVVDDGSIPEAGELLVYLVTAVNCSGESGFGAGSSIEAGRPLPPGCSE
ncbi:MAG: S8 family serine peptidase [bacterium]|nr:S8 family serine peptidase [bacterium]